MNFWLAQTIMVLSVILLVCAGWLAIRDRLINDLVMIIAIVTELALLAQVVLGLINIAEFPSAERKATFAAYLLTLPLVLAVTVYSAIKDKTRWAMASISIGAFAVAVMTLRLQQIWVFRGR